MKKITILKHGGGELANQLWNYVSIYAYSLECGAKITNPSFFEYHSYFKFIKNENLLIRFLSSWFKNHAGRRSNYRNRFWRNTYLIYVSMMKFFVKKNVLSSENERSQVVYLPPTSDLPVLENKKRAYFIGWLFRNPAGLKKFRNELVPTFAPNSIIEKKVAEIIKPIRQKYKRVIGIHIRQTDYRTFKGGIYFVPQTRVKAIIDEFILKNSVNINETLFLFASDGQIEKDVFKNLNIYVSKENSVTDLFLISSTDTIIGSDSSFGAFASWYGNIPHIVMTKDVIDWSYYTNKREYFENKYSKMVHY